jgi:hypothetical protein
LEIVAIAVFDDDHETAAVKSELEPSLKLPVAVKYSLVFRGIVEVEGVRVIDCRVAVETVNIVDPEIRVTGSVAVIVVVPALLPVAMPRFLGALLTPATFGEDDDHDTNWVRFRVRPSS